MTFMYQFMNLSIFFYYHVKLMSKCNAIYIQNYETEIFFVKLSCKAIK